MTEATTTFPAPLPIDRPSMATPGPTALPVTPGKVAMWLFLATEIMFFTGLIGSYIVLRAGSPPTSYSTLFPPNTALSGPMTDARGVILTAGGEKKEEVAAIVREVVGLDHHQAEEFVKETPQVVAASLTGKDADALVKKLEDAGAKADVRENKFYSWPQPYDKLTNPLSIDLTAFNTFILICSSVTMVLGLSAIQRGDKRKLSMYLLATVLIGSVFLGIQVIEYYKLMFGDLHAIGIGASRHFRPNVSLFASCFFTMTGFHGAHVFGGVVMLTCIWVQSMRGVFSAGHHSTVELVGLYWHFVDLVWIILFTVVYLV